MSNFIIINPNTAKRNYLRIETFAGRCSYIFTTTKLVPDRIFIDLWADGTLVIDSRRVWKYGK